jgi:pantoate--beta-alanine ligase
VVAKLFHIVGPQFAFFGQKDAAQVVTLQAMVRDLNFPLQLVVCPTVRDPEGIALSSRNRFLTPEQRSQAIALPKALAAVATAVNRGEFAAQPLRRLLEASLQSCPGLRLEYAEIVSPDTLEQVSDLARGALVAVAAWAGDTRLIDNIVIPPIPQAVHAEAEIPQEVSA